MNDFYITLNSHAGGDFQTSNTPQNFKCYLDKTLLLEGAWEIALVEARVPMTLYNVSESIGAVTVLSNVQDNTVEMGERQEVSHYQVPAGYYANISHLLAKLNKTLDAIAEFGLNEDGFVYIDLEKDKNFSAFYFSPILLSMLGFAPNEKIGQSTIHTAAQIFNLNTSFPSCLNVNTSIIQQQLCDSGHSETLRALPDFALKYLVGHDRFYIFERLHYKKLNLHRLEVLEINIRGMRGEVLSFLSGSSSVLLHLRRCVE